MTGIANDNVDPNVLLRRLRPHGGDEYLDPGVDPRADTLLRDILSRDAGGRYMPRRARRVTLLVAGLTVVGAGAAAAMIVTRSPHDTTQLSCFSSADVQHAVQVAVLPDTQRTPVEQCAELWSDGRLASDGAPQLVACVTDADIVAVIPGDESSCAAAGWALAAAPPTVPIADRTAELTATLSERFVEQCMKPDAAVRTVEDVLAELDLQTWTVHDATTNPEWCAAPSVEVRTQSVNVVSFPR
jgi:hypothetical protein